MDKFHLFLDEQQQAIAIADHPTALDEAPYDRITARLGLVDADEVSAILTRQGGLSIHADGQIKVHPQRPPCHQDSEPDRVCLATSSRRMARR